METSRIALFVLSARRGLGPVVQLVGSIVQLLAKACVGQFELGPPSGIVAQAKSLVQQLDELELMISVDLDFVWCVHWFIPNSQLV